MRYRDIAGKGANLPSGPILRSVSPTRANWPVRHLQRSRAENTRPPPSDKRGKPPEPQCGATPISSKMSSPLRRRHAKKKRATGARRSGCSSRTSFRLGKVGGFPSLAARTYPRGVRADCRSRLAGLRKQDIRAIAAHVPLRGRARNYRPQPMRRAEFAICRKVPRPRPKRRRACAALEGRRGAGLSLRPDRAITCPLRAERKSEIAEGLLERENRSRRRTLEPARGAREEQAPARKCRYRRRRRQNPWTPCRSIEKLRLDLQAPRAKPQSSGFSRAKSVSRQGHNPRANGGEPIAPSGQLHHDIRPSVSLWPRARIGVDLVVIERTLNHISGSFAGIVETYQRHKFETQMRDALERWARHVERVVAGAPAKR